MTPLKTAIVLSAAIGALIDDGDTVYCRILRQRRDEIVQNFVGIDYSLWARWPDKLTVAEREQITNLQNPS